MEIEMKKNAVDLTDLAIGILVLGITVAIGANVLINLRDNTLTDLPTETTANESVDITAGTNSDTLANTWVSSTSTTCLNGSNDALIGSGNYTVAIDSVTGTGTISNATVLDASVNHTWNCSYSTYDTTQEDWALPNDAATGLAEYGNWFDIIVIVGVAAVILSLIFMAFGNREDGTGNISY